MDFGIIDERSQLSSQANGFSGQVDIARGWEVATTLPPHLGATAHEFEAADYDELVDHPVELGRFWRGEFTAAGVTHEFVVAGALPSFDGDRLLADAQRICEAEIAFWHADGGPPPFSSTSLVSTKDSKRIGRRVRSA